MLVRVCALAYACVCAALRTPLLLGLLTEYGFGTPRNFRSAAVWYQKASEQKHIEATYNLGLMYTYGRCVCGSPYARLPRPCYIRNGDELTYCAGVWRRTFCTDPCCLTRCVGPSLRVRNVMHAFLKILPAISRPFFVFGRFYTSCCECG